MCPNCGRVYCDCSADSRGQSYDEMIAQDQAEFDRRKTEEEARKKAEKK